MTSPTTLPIENTDDTTAPAVLIAATYKDPTTGALYVHQDLRLARADWEEEGHIPPAKSTERFGDVESWVQYVQRFAETAEEDGETAREPLLTWNTSGLRAVLDYHQGFGDAGRCQWQAFHPFLPSAQWQAWMKLANGAAIGQKSTVEALEDLAEDIREPAPADLAALLRSLRASVNAKADTELRPDGTSSVAFSKDAQVRSGSGAAAGEVTLPAQIAIAIPVLKGHVDQSGAAVLYRVAVRLRVSVDDQAHLAFRLSIPNAERVLETALLDRVAAAKQLLGESLPLLRGADA